MFAIETKNLTKKYKEKIAVNEINLKINQCKALYIICGEASPNLLPVT